jgi:hypothetical protein
MGVKGRVAVGARVTAEVTLGLAALLLAAYFLLAAGPGRSLAAVVLEDEMNGRATFGNILLDPFGASLSVVDLAIHDPTEAPVAALEVAYAVPRSLLDNAYETVRLGGLFLHVVVDEEGNVNLARLAKEKKKKRERPPEPVAFAVDRLDLGDSHVRVETPLADLDVGPISVTGSLAAGEDGIPKGDGVLTAARIVLDPKLEDETVRLLARILGLEGKRELGPLVMKAGTRDEVLDIPDLSVVLSDLALQAAGHAGLETGAFEATLRLVRQDRTLATLAASLAGDSWRLSTRLDGITLPPAATETLSFPGLEIAGIELEAGPESLTLNAARLRVPELSGGGFVAGGLTLAMKAAYQAAQPLQELGRALAAAASPEEGIGRVLEQWKEGALELALTIDSAVCLKRQYGVPMIWKLRLKPLEAGRFALSIGLEVAPGGRLEIDLEIQAPGADGTRPYSAVLRARDLPLWCPLELAEASAMLRNMLVGRMTGELVFTSRDLASPLLLVESCRFDFADNPSGIYFFCPEEVQTWDMAAGIDLSPLLGKVHFGKGMMWMKMRPAGGLRQR